MLNNKPRRGRDRIEEYKRHKTYLKQIKSSSYYCPRYDMLSLNNNLLLHRNFDPKKQLVPKPNPQAVVEIEKEIQLKMRPNKKVEPNDKAKWYEQILRKGEVTELKFKFEYVPASAPSCSMREQFGKIYNLTRESWGKTRNSSLLSKIER